MSKYLEFARKAVDEAGNIAPYLVVDDTTAIIMTRFPPNPSLRRAHLYFTGRSVAERLGRPQKVVFVSAAGDTLVAIATTGAGEVSPPVAFTISRGPESLSFAPCEVQVASVWEDYLIEAFWKGVADGLASAGR